MARLKVTEPIISGSTRGSIDLSGVSNTDWNDLTSADFIDVTTGSACASGLAFEWIGFTNEGSDVMFIKYRARTLASDPTTNEIAVGQIFSDDIVTLRTKITTIAYKKAGASDTVRIIAGFAAI
jgi:hypothetical protein